MKGTAWIKRNDKITSEFSSRKPVKVTSCFF